MSQDRRGRVALSAFFKISKAWALSEEDEAAILAQADRMVLHSWKRGEDTKVDEETILRISYVIGIFRAISTLLPREDVAHAWLKEPNEASILGGRSALDRMTDGDLEGLKLVRQYLDAESPPADVPNRLRGTLKGKIHIPGDFDPLPTDIIDAMEGG